GKEKVVKEKVVAEKVEVVVAGKAKKKDRKRKHSGINIDEGRSKMKDDKQDESSGTESDDVPLAQKLKQKTSEAYA
ncbi:hypothetical protein A2U01_0100966, partial [Trifolium medium]|nr:hypothetical protein [Trifolium medium]